MYTSTAVHMYTESYSYMGTYRVSHIEVCESKWLSGIEGLALQSLIFASKSELEKIRLFSCSMAVKAM